MASLSNSESLSTSTSTRPTDYDKRAVMRLFSEFHHPRGSSVDNDVGLKRAHLTTITLFEKVFERCTTPGSAYYLGALLRHGLPAFCAYIASNLPTSDTYGRSLHLPLPVVGVSLELALHESCMTAEQFTQGVDLVRLADSPTSSFPPAGEKVIEAFAPSNIITTTIPNSTPNPDSIQPRLQPRFTPTLNQRQQIHPHWQFLQRQPQVTIPNPQRQPQLPIPSPWSPMTVGPVHVVGRSQALNSPPPPPRASPGPLKLQGGAAPPTGSMMQPRTSPSPSHPSTPNVKLNAPAPAGGAIQIQTRPPAASTTTSTPNGHVGVNGIRVLVGASPPVVNGLGARPVAANGAVTGTTTRNGTGAVTVPFAANNAATAVAANNAATANSNGAVAANLNRPVAANHDGAVASNTNSNNVVTANGARAANLTGTSSSPATANGPGASPQAPTVSSLGASTGAASANGAVPASGVVGANGAVPANGNGAHTTTTTNGSAVPANVVVTTNGNGALAQAAQGSVAAKGPGALPASANDARTPSTANGPSPGPRGGASTLAVIGKTSNESVPTNATPLTGDKRSTPASEEGPNKKQRVENQSSHGMVTRRGKARG